MSPAERGAPRWGPIELGPPLAAAIIFGVGQGRVVLAVPMALAMVAAVVLRIEGSHSTRSFALSGSAGGVVGLIAGFINPPFSPYFPPPLLSALCGGLAGLVLYCVYTRSIQYSGVYAWVLTALSTDIGSGSLWLGAALLGLALTTMLVAARDARIWQGSGWRGVIGVLAFAALAVPGAVALARLAEASVDPLLGLVMRLTQDLPRPHGVGIDTELRVRRVSQVPDDDTVLFEVAQPFPERLRSIAFDSFDGEVWRTSEALSQQHPALPTGGDRHTSLTFSEEVGPMVPAAAGTTAISGVTTDVQGAWVVHTPQPLRAATIDLTYSSKGVLPPEPGLGATDLPPALAAELLPLARGIVGSARTSRERATAIERFFADNFEYTLLTDLSGPGNPLLRLIRERKPAYCIYFASAAAALLRSLGIPARVVGGFVPGDANPLTGRATVRARDAHAWVEAYLADEGRYSAIDPTPWRSRSALTPRPTALALALEAFSSAVRIRYLEAGGTPGRAFLAVFRSRLLIGLVVVFVVVRFARLRRRPTSNEQAPAGEAADARLRDAYRRYLGVLQKAGGLQPAEHESEAEFLARLDLLGLQAPAHAATTFLTGYHHARFGGAPIPADGWNRELEALQLAFRETPKGNRAR